MFKKLISPQLLFLAGIQFGVSILGALFVQFILFPQPKIATVNITALVDSFVKETASSNLSNKEKQQRVTNYAKQLTITMQQIAQSKHEILVPSEALLAGGFDETEKVVSMIKRGL